MNLWNKLGEGTKERILEHSKEEEFNKDKLRTLSTFVFLFLFFCFVLFFYAAIVLKKVTSQSTPCLKENICKTSKLSPRL